MFRKGAFPIAVLTAICSTLFYWWTDNAFDDVFKEIPIAAVVLFMAYFSQFMLIFGAIYDIIHKVKIKYNKNLLKSGICGVILFTALFKGFEYSNIFLAYVFVATLVCLLIFTNIGIKLQKEE